MSERKRFLLRIDQGLWDEVQRMAAREFRSVNAQIEYLLENAVRSRGGRSDPKAGEDEASVPEAEGRSRG